MVMAIGDRKAVSQLAQELTRNPRDGYVLVGAGIPGYGPSRGKTLLVNGREIPILGDEAHAVAAIGQCGADTVALTGTERLGAQGLRQLMWRLETMDVDLVVAPGVMDVAEGRLALRPFGGFLLLHVEKPQYEGAKRFQKRAFDFGFALAALIGTSPLLICSGHRCQTVKQRPGLLPVRADRFGWKTFYHAQIPNDGRRCRQASSAVAVS